MLTRGFFKACSSALSPASKKLIPLMVLPFDLDQPRVLFATEGRDANTIAAFADDLTAHRGDPDAIDEVCTDMSPASSKASPGVCPTPSTSSTLSRSRRRRRSGAPRRTEGAKSVTTRYIWLPDPANLSDRQRPRHWKIFQRVISRPHEPTRYGSPFRTSMRQVAGGADIERRDAFTAGDDGTILRSCFVLSASRSLTFAATPR
jgi:transposase